MPIPTPATRLIAPLGDSVAHSLLPRFQNAALGAARERGIPAADGRDMLIHQGAAAFERWWGIPAPAAVMWSAVGRP